MIVKRDGDSSTHMISVFYGMLFDIPFTIACALVVVGAIYIVHVG